MLQVSVLRLPGRGLRLPTRIRTLRIDPSIHLDMVKDGVCEVKVDPRMEMVVAGGVEMSGKIAFSRRLLDLVGKLKNIVCIIGN